MSGAACNCPKGAHDVQLIALTGGPGAGKTAVLEVVRRNFCRHVSVLPESASILFGGGFPRREGLPARFAAQRAIYHVQVELERMVREEQQVAVALCDRGTVDGLAYWPGDDGDYWRDLGTTLAHELARYTAVIHLRTPSAGQGYDHSNPVRTESAADAARLDERIARAWARHPRRIFVESRPDFLEKLAAAVTLIRAEVPACCWSHPLPAA